MPIRETSPRPIGWRRLPFFSRLPSRESALRQTATSLADQAVVSAANFFAGIIIGRSCSKEELGLYALGFSIITTVVDLQTSIITTPYMIYSPRLGGRAHASYTGSTLIHQLALSLVTMAAVACGALAVGHGHGNHSLAPVLWALSLFIAFIMLREHARRICFARLRIGSAFVMDATVAVCQISGLIILAHYGLLSASRAYWVIGPACGLAVAGWLWTDRRGFRLCLGESIADFKNNWTLGKWVFASGLLWTVSVNLYPWLLMAFHGVAAAGIWAACLGVTSAGNPLLMGLQNIIGPKISHAYAANGPGRLRGFTLKIAGLVAMPMLLLCSIVFIWGGSLVTLLYGHQYSGNGWVVAVLALNLLFVAIIFPISRALFVIGRANVDFLVNFVALLIMVTIGLWLVRDLGPLGAALGLVLAGFASSIVRFLAFLKLTRSAARPEILL